MTQPSTILTCPKCGSDMRAYERNGVTIDQCTGCKGIFLDRGELERLVDAEGAYYESARPQPGRQAPPPYDQGYAAGHGQSGGHGQSRSGHGSSKGGRRREGFLGDLFG